MTPPAPQKTKPVSAYTIAGIALGGFAIVAVFVPGLLMYGFLAGLLGLFSSLDGLRRARKGGHAGRTAAIVGVALSGAALAIFVIGLAVYSAG